MMMMMIGSSSVSVSQPLMNVYTAGKASCFSVVVVVGLSINMANMCNTEAEALLCP